MSNLEYCIEYGGYFLHDNLIHKLVRTFLYI